MAVITVSHIAIGVKEMDRSVRFYTEVFGLRVALDNVEDSQNPRLGAVRRRAVYLRWDDDPLAPFLVLDELLSHPRQADANSYTGTGVHHYGFWVEDIDAALERAERAGARIARPAKDLDTELYGEASGGLVRTAIVIDPDGNAVQLDQRLVDGTGAL